MAATTFAHTPPASAAAAFNASSCKVQRSSLSLSSSLGSSQNLGLTSGLRNSSPLLLLLRNSEMQRITSGEVIARGVDSRAEAAAASPNVQTAGKQKEAAEIVQEFYGAINRREVDSIGDLFAEDCVYEDLVFPKPFLGRKAVLEFFKKFMESVGPELEFRVDDISTGDPDAAGVIWHLEWRGKQFPFSKGCSFYRCEIIDGKRQIKYGRDSVEPATKPGDFTLVALRGVAALLRKFPSLADRF